MSRIVNKLLSENYIYCTNPKGSPKLYKPTDKPLPFVDTFVDNLRGGRHTASYGVCRTHCISRSYLLSRPPEIKVSWDQQTVNNGTTFCDMKRVFDIGLVSIRLIKGNGNNGQHGKLVIWMPEKYLSYEQLENEKRILDNYCQHVANWFMKTYHCQLGLPEKYQKPHFAFVDDPAFLDTAKRMNLSSEHSWVDRSKNRSEWETDDVKLAKVKMELPERVLSLEVKVDGIEITVNRIANSIDRLMNLFNAPVSPDERRDVT